MDEDGDQEHRRDRKVLQRQNHHRVRHGGVGRRADRPEDPASERAERGHRRNGQSSEENVRLFRNQGLPLCLQMCLWPSKSHVLVKLLKNFWVFKKKKKSHICTFSFSEHFFLFYCQCVRVKALALEIVCYIRLAATDAVNQGGELRHDI